MSESNKGFPNAAGNARSRTEPLDKYLQERSREIPASECALSIWHHSVEAGFPRVGEEIHIDLGRDRTLVLKYKGTDENKDLVFKWVATVS